MSNIIAGYRKMTGISQKEMGKYLDISETTYRNKEKGRIPFKDYEIIEFYKLVKKEKPDVLIPDIFFTNKTS